MDLYYDHQPILQQQYYAFVFPISAEWVVNIPAHYTMPIFYPQPVQYVDDVAILNTPDAMWVNQEQHPTHSYFRNNNYVPYQTPEHAFFNTSDSLTLDETLIMQEIEEEISALQGVIGAGTSDSGLSEVEISEHLQVYAAQGKMSEVDTCSICLGEYEKKEKMGRLECGHRCIKRWLLSKNVCPMCRSTALTIQV